MLQTLRICKFSRNLTRNCEKCRCLSSTKASADTGYEPVSRILVEKDANITLIGINREHARNSIDTATAQQLNEAFQTFEADATSPVAVLYGIGGTFCAGQDLSDLEKQLSNSTFDFLLNKEGSVEPTHRYWRKPVVCGINGFCVASGLELALVCDLRVMEDTAVLGFFNRGFGVPLSDRGTARLAAAVGHSNALDLILTGRRVTGTQALQMGLINRLVATGTALGQAVNLAFSIAKFPLASLQHDRNSLYAGSVCERRGFEALVHSDMTLDMHSQITQEMHEGVSRFKNSNTKGPKTDSRQIKEKIIPDWEKEEIAYEEKAAKLKKLTKTS